MSDPRKPQASQCSANVHGSDARVRLTAAPDSGKGTVLPDATNIDGVAGATEAEAGRAMTSVETICSIRLRPSRMGVCAFLSTLSDMTYIRRNATHREMSVIRFASLCSTSSVLLNIFSAEPASITVHWIFWRTDPCCCRRKCKLSSFARRLRTSVSRSLRLCRMMASVRTG
jgi:hypothetical protein